MTHQARFGKRHFNCRGLWLVELAIGLGVSVAMMSVVLCSARAQLDSARSKQALIGMRSILEAGIGSYAVKGTWPEDFDQVGELLSSTSMKNPWGGSYVLSHSDSRIWVETIVPEGILPQAGQWPVVHVAPYGNGSRWRMSAPLSYGSFARLMYENK